MEKAESSFGASPAGVEYIRAVSLCSPLISFRFSIFRLVLRLVLRPVLRAAHASRLAFRSAFRSAFFVSRIALASRHFVSLSMLARGR